MHTLFRRDLHTTCIVFNYLKIDSEDPLRYTPKAVVIDYHLPRQPLISSYVPDWPLPPRVYIPSESEMALRARIYAYNRHLSFDVAFICSTLTHCGICHLSVWRLKWEVSYVHQSVWRWKWFFCQSNYVLQLLRLCRTSDTVFRREIDSRRQWGYGTCYGGIVSPLRRSVPLRMSKWLSGNTRLTVHFMCGLMSDLVMCKCRKEYAYGHAWHQMSLLR